MVVPALVGRKQGGVSMVVKLRVHGRPYLFKVDTGASRTIVDTIVAKALALPDRGAAT